MSHSMAAAIPVAQQDVDTRATFIGRTYSHLFGAIFLFTAIEILLFRSETNLRLLEMMAGRWWLFLGGFIVAGWLATHVAHSARSLPLQYLALGGFVAAEAVIFCPLLTYAVAIDPSGGILKSAVFFTFLGFTGLTGVAFFSRRDFTFLGGILRWGGICALLAIVGGMIFGYTLGLFFSLAMVALAGGAILYDTSKVLRQYPEDRYVGAALELFASVAMLFYYVLMTLIQLQGRD